MATFSRWMQPPPKPMSRWAAWLTFAALISPFLLAAAFTRGGKIVLGFLVLVGTSGTLVSRQRLRRLAADRRGEDIGTFARAFDRRAEPFDPRVVRAVWDALQPYMTLGRERAPLRPTDRIDEDLDIDWDDIDMCVLQEVAERAGRSLDGIEANPLHGRVATVGDLVRLLSAQPRRAAA